MPQTGLWLRVFVGLLIAVLPPLLLLVAAVLLTETVLADLEPGLVAILVVLGSTAWAAILGIVYSRALGDDFRALLSLAMRGEQHGQSEVGDAYRAAGELARRAKSAGGIAGAGRRAWFQSTRRREHVVAAVVSAVRSVMRDSTWRCAVLASETMRSSSARGLSGARKSARIPDPIGDLEQWASVSTGEVDAGRIEGPWGAFAVDRRRGQRSPPRHPLRAVGGPAGAFPGGGRPADPRRPARRQRRSSTRCSTRRSAARRMSSTGWPPSRRTSCAA